MTSISRRAASGFSLLETLVATSILVTVTAGLAELLAKSVQLTRDTGHRLAALDAAQAKLEWLRVRTLTFDADGVPVTDAALAPSCPGALDRTTTGCSDWLDEAGQPTDGGGSTPGVLLRRWSITPLDDRVPDAITIEVCVFLAPARDGPAAAAEICLSTIRARQP